MIHSVALAFFLASLCLFGAAQSRAAFATGIVPPPDESHATKPIRACGERHFDPRLEFCDSRNNRLYRFTRVGSQTWMAENLDYGQMIPGSADQSQPGQKYCLYDKASDCGALYQWAEAMALDPSFNRKIAAPSGKVQGICPAGWRLPHSADWEQLLTLVRKQQGDQSEAVSLMAYSPNDDFRWKSNTTPDSMLPIHDRYGLSVVPSGHRVLQGTCPDGRQNDSFFCNAHDMAKFWTSDEDPTDPEIGINIAVIEDLPHVIDSSKSVMNILTPEEKQKWIALAKRKALEQSDLQRSYKSALKLHGMSVRCIKD